MAYDENTALLNNLLC